MSKIAIIPTEMAIVPTEEANQPLSLNDASNNPSQDNSQRQITFSSDSKIGDTQSSQSSGFKVGLSQPLGRSHRERMLWLQRRRTEGLWVSCDTCSRWRYLPHVIDRYELPDKWYCKMNTDKTLADCSAPEVPIQLHDEEDLIHNRFSAGSVVWAKLPGWPWWPAMVDDCPDTEQFYWLDGFSDIPTHYHVVFFDKLDVSRAWVSDQSIKPYTINDKNKIEDANQNKKYEKRLKVAIRQAADAFSLPLTARFTSYSFLARYKGKILTPTKILKIEIEKYRKNLKRKFDVDFPLSSDSEESSSAEDESTSIGDKTASNKSKAKAMKQKDTTEEAGKMSGNSDTLANCLDQSEVNEAFKEINSLKVHFNSTDDDVLSSTFLDNGLSGVVEIEGVKAKDTAITDSDLEFRAASRGSDEFEF